VRSLNRLEALVAEYHVLPARLVGSWVYTKERSLTTDPELVGTFGYCRVTGGGPTGCSGRSRRRCFGVG
jgi:hypothetical protein